MLNMGKNEEQLKKTQEELKRFHEQSKKERRKEHIKEILQQLIDPAKAKNNKWKWFFRLIRLGYIAILIGWLFRHYNLLEFFSNLDSEQVKTGIKSELSYLRFFTNPIFWLVISLYFLFICTPSRFKNKAADLFGQWVTPSVFNKTFILVFFITANWLILRYSNEYIKSTFMEFNFMFLNMLFTYFVIDRVSEYYDRQQWRNVKDELYKSFTQKMDIFIVDLNYHTFDVMKNCPYISEEHYSNLLDKAGNRFYENMKQGKGLEIVEYEKKDIVEIISYFIDLFFILDNLELTSTDWEYDDTTNTLNKVQVSIPKEEEEKFINYEKKVSMDLLKNIKSFNDYIKYYILNAIKVGPENQELYHKIVELEKYLSLFEAQLEKVHRITNLSMDNYWLLVVGQIKSIHILLSEDYVIEYETVFENR